MAEIKNEGLPGWIYEKYPEIIAKTKEGKEHVTKVVSYLHPNFIKCVDKWYKAVCKIVQEYQYSKGGPVIMFQLDNEVGMLQWVTNQADYNDCVLDEFKVHLKEQNFLEELKRLTQGIDFKDYEDFIEYLKKPNIKWGLNIENEYMIFMRKYYKMYLEKLKSICEGYGVECPFVINIHGFDNMDYAKRGGRYPIGISQLYDTASIENTILAGDYYIGNIIPENYHDIVLANAFTKAVQNENQPLFSAEFQGGFQNGKPILQPSTIDLNTRLCIATGMNALNYYMFSGGENYEKIGLLGRRHDWQAPISTDGKLRRSYFKIEHLGNILKAQGEDILKTKQKIQTHLAFYADYYMTEYSSSYTKEIFDTLKQFREFYLFDGVGRGLVKNNIPFEGYDIKKYMDIDVEKIPTLWMLSTRWMDENIQNKLINYIDNGGNLVLFGALPTKDLKGNDCTCLLNYLKVNVVSEYHYKHGVIEEVDSINTMYMEGYEGEDLKGFAYPEDAENEISAFEKNIGLGKVVVLGFGMEYDYDYKNEVLLKLAKRIGVEPIVKINEKLDINFRENKADGSKFMFVHNYNDYDIEDNIYFEEKHLFDGKKLKVNARQGLILPLEYTVKPYVKVLYSTCEIVEKDEKVLRFKCLQDREYIKINCPCNINDVIEKNITKISDDEYLVEIIDCKNKIIKINF